MTEKQKELLLLVAQIQLDKLMLVNTGRSRDLDIRDLAEGISAVEAE